MKEKKNETEKKRSEKKFQCGNRTSDLLICSQLPPQGLIAHTKPTYPPTYTANLNGHELRVASLAPPIIDLCNLTVPQIFHGTYFHPSMKL